MRGATYHTGNPAFQFTCNIMLGHQLPGKVSASSVAKGSYHKMCRAPSSWQVRQRPSSVSWRRRSAGRGCSLVLSSAASWKCSFQTSSDQPPPPAALAHCPGCLLFHDSEHIPRARVGPLPSDMLGNTDPFPLNKPG